MKTTKFFLSGLAALALLACNKNETFNGLADAKDASVSVTIQATPAMRAVAEDPANEQKISDATVLVYNAAGIQEACKAAQLVGAEWKAEDIKCTTGEHTILVVANKGTLAFEDLTLEEAKDLTCNLEGGIPSATADHLMMTAEVKKVLKEGNDPENDVEANLAHVHAAVKVKKVDTEFSDAFKKKFSVELSTVMALVAKKESKIFGEDLTLATAGFYFGEKVPAGTYTPATYEVKKFLTMVFSMPYGVNEATDELLKKAGFYLLSNKEEDVKYPTILCFKGTLKDAQGNKLSAEEAKIAAEMKWIVSETDHTTFYPVIINRELGKTTKIEGNSEKKGVERNHKYFMEVDINGPGTNTPENPVAKDANLSVTCKVQAWNEVTQKVVW